MILGVGYRFHRAGRDVGKVLQRYLLSLTPNNEKLQPSLLVAELRYLCSQNDRICKTLKIFLPTLHSFFFYTFLRIKLR
jgi:hypothetical protein